jgi:hypothetical protein
VTDLAREVSEILGDEVIAIPSSKGTILRHGKNELFISPGQPVCAKAIAANFKRHSIEADGWITLHPDRQEGVSTALSKAWNHIASEEAPEHLTKLLDALK